MAVTDWGIVIPVRLEQLKKVLLSIVSIPSDSVTEVRPVQLLKQPSPNDVTLLGMVILVSEVHPLKASVSKSVTLLPSVTEARLVHSWKPPTVVVLSGIVMDLSAVHPLKAFLSIVSIPSDSVTCDSIGAFTKALLTVFAHEPTVHDVIVGRTLDVSPLSSLSVKSHSTEPVVPSWRLYVILLLPVSEQLGFSKILLAYLDHPLAPLYVSAVPHGT